MRRVLVLAGIFALVPALLAAGCGDDDDGGGGEAKARPGPYVAMGDSLSVGYLSESSPESKGFVGRLLSGYKASLAVNKLLNGAETGASSTSLRKKGQLAGGLEVISAPSDTKALTIEIGGNEAIGDPSCPGHWHQAGVCPFRANLADILGKLKTALDDDPGSEQITTMAYYNPASGVGGQDETAIDEAMLGDNGKVGCSDSGTALGLNDVIYQEAGKVGVPVANPYPAFKQHGQAYMSQADSLHIHPNDAGYAAIAQAFRRPSRLCG